VDPNAFIAEVYRRMSARHAGEAHRPSWSEMETDAAVLAAASHYKPYLPKDKSARILDIGFGTGWFLAACLKLGYENLHAADYGTLNNHFVGDWAPHRITLCEIHGDIGEFLSDRKEQYDFIHMSHVIEHIPKYSLLWAVDALYWALKRGGKILLRTPNMEGPCANSSFYITLSHEYGFAGANLISLLDVCGFDDVRLLTFGEHAPSLRRRIAHLLRWPLLQENRFRHRLFGTNRGGQFGPELIAIGTRGNWPPYFDPQYR
jgi:2-polyprenyl-3-methyl-5-hydroxy-6-metoxy-1,4-benzoquinol methylase